MNKKLMTAAAVLLAFTTGVGGAMAYYTAQTDTVENTFHIVAGGGGSGDAVGEVEETFDPEDAKNLSPRASFTKEAALSSSVDYDSYAYMLVTIPNIYAKKGTETEKSWQDAVTMDIDTTNWEQVKAAAGSETTPSRYLYRYKTVLSAQSKTGKLCTKGTVPDFTEAEELSGSIDITGYMLSSANVTTADADADAIANFFG